MTLDAIFGDVGQATQAVIDAIGKHGDTNFEYPRLRLLLGLRNSVIHGGAPDVYDSDNIIATTKHTPTILCTISNE